MLLALDAGTGSVRAILFDINGNQVGRVQKEWTHREDPRFSGSMNFDWNKNWALACACLREALEQTAVDARQITAVSTTCMREGIVLYDKTGVEIWACANVDARSNDEARLLKLSDPRLEVELYHKSGQTFALSALPRLLWVKNKMPEIYKKTAKIGMFNDWLVYKLSGVLAVEPSNGSTTGLFDLKKRTWDASIAQRCGLRDDVFPDTVECGTLIAKVSKKGAAETGLIEGTPIVAGGGDCQLGTIGVGVTSAYESAIFGGSFWQYECNTASAVTPSDCSVRVNCHALPNLWQYEALAFNPGLAMRWFRDGFCQEESRLAAARGADTYALMDTEAANIPAGCYGMACTFSDIMNFIAWRHAAPAFINFELSPEKFNKYTFYRAIMENTALVTRGHLELVEKTHSHLSAKTVFAGGASKSRLWAQILADALGIPVDVPVVKEATALGAAILAGVGVGLYTDIQDTARKLVKIERTFVPNEENADVYREAFKQWRQIYKNQLMMSDEKITRYMWSAPSV
ncbi:MAG: autoinducer-2 kinase [Treponema sp.]|jgi:autoinducer 2 (AI-2) kinase|nr:autoinducer-2 kinase [Treponema sp.]